MQFSIIAAFTPLTQVIGNNNKIPWRLSSDLKHFKQLTLDKTIIMGRKTHESIGKPLPKRNNIILSRDPELQIKGCKTYTNLYTLHKDYKDSGELFIIGGEQIYKMSMTYVNKMYITLVMGQYEGDTFFPPIEGYDWNIESIEKHKKSKTNECDYTFLTLRRKGL